MSLILKGGIWEASCFHAQQAAEKFLKAYLVFRDEMFPYTHDLAPLLDQAARSDPRFKRYKRLAKRLSPYAVQVRYVGTVSPTKAQAQNAAKGAAAFCRFVSALLPKAVLGAQGKKR
jgi:HEPN domain-containing protein